MCPPRVRIDLSVSWYLSELRGPEELGYWFTGAVSVVHLPTRVRLQEADLAHRFDGEGITLPILFDLPPGSHLPGFHRKREEFQPH